jgi:hypothetical protein
MGKRTVVRKLMLGAVAAAFAAGLSAFAATPAEAKQCVWNKGGFTLRVDWFQSNDLEIQPGGAANGQTAYHLMAQPVQSDTITTASGRCISRGGQQYTALFSICGLANGTSHEIQTMPDEWPADQRIGCPVWKQAMPSTSRYMDVWGTVWSPQSGNGGPVE